LIILIRTIFIFLSIYFFIINLNINKATENDNKQKQTLSFLFDKLNEVRELETIDRLRQFQGGNKYLLAYLTYKSISRANYQVELTKHTDFDTDEQGQFKLLEAIAKDLEVFEEKEETNKRLGNNELIEEMVSRLRSRELITNDQVFNNFTGKREYMSNEVLISWIENLQVNKEWVEKEVKKFLKKHRINRENV